MLHAAPYIRVMVTLVPFPFRSIDWEQLGGGGAFGMAAATGGGREGGSRGRLPGLPSASATLAAAAAAAAEEALEAAEDFRQLVDKQRRKRQSQQ